MVYSISPSRDVKLRRIGALSDVIPFKSSMAASYMNNKIVVYSSQGRPVFNTFDTATRMWSGPGLVKSQLQVSDDLDDTSSKVPLAAIIGGAVGGLVVIAVAVFLIIRYRRKTRSPGNSAEKVDSGNTNADTAPVQQSPSSPPPTQQVVISEELKIQQPQPSYVSQPQPSYLPQPQPPQPSYVPQPQQPQPLYLPQQFMHQPQPLQQYGQFGPQQPHPHTVMYPDGQRQSYIYVPPTFVPVQQPYPDPNSPSYSQRAHSPPVPGTSGTNTNTSAASSPTSPQHPHSFRH